MDHFLNRNFHKFGSIVRNFPAHAVWKILLQNRHFFFYCSRRCQSVTAVRQHHCHTGGVHAVQACRSRIVLHTQADFGNVFQIDVRAVGIGYQNDVAELFSSAQLTLRCNGCRNGLSRHSRQRTDRACRNLDILCRKRIGYRCKRQVVVLQFFRINPNTHSALRTKQSNLTHAVDTLQLRYDIALRVVIHLLNRLPFGRKHHYLQEVGTRLRYGYTILLYGRG